METKKKKFNRNEILFALSGLLLIALIPLITSTGVSSPYWRTNPIKLSPGESTIVTLELQNMVGEEDVTLRASVNEANVIVSLMDQNTDYLVPFGSSDIPVRIKIEVPSNAKVGDIYQVPILFQEVSPGEGGMIKMASAISKTLPVQVVDTEESVLYGEEAEKKNYAPFILGILIIGVLVGVIIYTLNLNKKKK
ncbi:hypothetical protein K0A97_03115 [Patescibacteria group bacterium]|nr:hypothetical protein [Patescibacteria group bacterium]